MQKSPAYYPVQFHFTTKLEQGAFDSLLVGDLFLPPEVYLAAPKAILVCWPGGSYTRREYHLEVPGYAEDAYSFGLAMARRGYLVLAWDQLGTGESITQIPNEHLTLPVLAEADASAITCLKNALRNGQLSPHLPPLFPLPLIVGIGHSLGAQIAIVTQAHHQSYDALALLGWSNQHITFAGVEQPLHDPTEEKTEHEVVKGTIISRQQRELRSLRVMFRPLFYANDVPQAVIEADEAVAIPIPPAITEHANDTYMASAAAALSLPLFLANGGKADIASVFRAEASHYPNCADISLVELPNSAHCHLFSSDRGKLAGRLDRWIEQF